METGSSVSRRPRSLQGALPLKLGQQEATPECENQQQRRPSSESQLYVNPRLQHIPVLPLEVSAFPNGGRRGVGSQKCMRKAGGTGKAPGLGERAQPWPPARCRAMSTHAAQSRPAERIFHFLLNTNARRRHRHRVVIPRAVNPQSGPSWIDCLSRTT